MKEHPILFSGPMVRAILDGKKTQTRRVISKRNSAVLGEPLGRLWDHLHFDHGTGPTVDRGETMFGCGPDCDYLHVPAWHPDYPEDVVSYRVRPVYRPGDRLWVKETHAFYALNYQDLGTWHPVDRDVCCHYREGCPMDLTDRLDKWRPSIFMPRWASRITLEIVRVRAERVQSISNDDAYAEGIPSQPPKSWLGGGWREAAAFASLWEKINGRESWAANPWVWVLEFRRVQ